MALPAVSAQPIYAPVDVGCGDLVLVPPPEPVRRDKDHSGWLHGPWSRSPVTAGGAHVCAGGGGWGGADGSQAPPDGKRGGCKRRSGRNAGRQEGRKKERKKERKMSGNLWMHVYSVKRFEVDGPCWIEAGVVGKGRSNTYLHTYL